MKLIASDEELKLHLYQTLRTDEQDCKIASRIDPECSGVRIISSEKAGMGKNIFNPLRYFQDVKKISCKKHLNPHAKLGIPMTFG